MPSIERMFDSYVNQEMERDAGSTPFAREGGWYKGRYKQAPALAPIDRGESGPDLQRTMPATNL
jgi:hypothetical protein